MVAGSNSWVRHLGEVDEFVEIDVDTSARYVRVQLWGSGRQLRLTEIEVLDLPDAPEPPVALVGAESTWRYNDSGTMPARWTEASFDDASWSTGPAQFGFGDGDEATVVSSDGLVVLHRQDFEVDDPSVIESVDLDLIADDGAVVWINGVEVLRHNVDPGAVTATTRASSSVWGGDERDPHSFSFTNLPLVAGTNTIAVSIHNAGPWSGDLSFDASMVAHLGEADTTAPTAPPGIDGALDGDVATIGWKPSTDDRGVAAYRVLRDGVEIGSTTATTFTDSGLAPATAYLYTVVAVDAAGNVSDESDPVTLTTASPVTVLLDGDSTWRFNDTGDFADGWAEGEFDDSAWTTGSGQFGFGDGDEDTVTQRGTLVTYFRTTFDADEAERSCCGAGA